MTSIATTAFDVRPGAARARRSSTRPSGGPRTRSSGRRAAPLPALGGLPRTGAIAAAARALDAGETTCVELTELALARIAEDEWTAFVEVCAEDALAEARARDAELQGRPAARTAARHPGLGQGRHQRPRRPHPLRLGRLRRRAGRSTPTASTSGARPAP